MSQKFTLIVLMLLLFYSSLVMGSCKSETSQVAASEALESLRKMSGEVKTNLTLQEYRTRLSSMKAEVEKKQTQIPEGELKTQINRAKSAYIDAERYWTGLEKNKSLTMTGNEAAAVEKAIKAYNIPANEINPSDIASSARYIWGAADKYIERATELNSKR
ncbi:MAG: hypothetical protein LC768_01465 [Acidobacteria bacterium]|nr:hypothetical protein [Acidobacteriota bacterium]MCA1637000.1 hypothetical protein [Acidobacteriota bacterium]